LKLTHQLAGDRLDWVTDLHISSFAESKQCRDRYSNTWHTASSCKNCSSPNVDFLACLGNKAFMPRLGHVTVEYMANFRSHISFNVMERHALPSALFSQHYKLECLDVGYYKVSGKAVEHLDVCFNFVALNEAWTNLFRPIPQLEDLSRAEAIVQTPIGKNIAALSQAHGPSDEEGVVPEDLWVLWPDEERVVDFRQVRSPDKIFPGLLSAFSEQLGRWVKQQNLEQTVWFERD
jgi:hypothetical protein